MKILIVDDHPIFRDGLRRILSEEFRAAIFGDAGNATEALERVWKEKWDLVLLDITMHGRTGLDVLKEIRRSASDLPVLIVSAHPEDQYAVRVLRAGAAGYLTKESASHELCTAVKKLLVGGKYISASLAEQLAAEIQSPHGDLHETLSNREYQVMLLIAAGKVPKEIGSELSLSAKTISTYRSRILEKLKLRNNAEIMRNSGKSCFRCRHGSDPPFHQRPPADSPKEGLDLKDIIFMIVATVARLAPSWD